MCYQGCKGTKWPVPTENYKKNSYSSSPMMVYSYMCVCGNNWISDLCGLGMSRCKFIFFECPVFLGKRKGFRFNYESLQPEFLVDNGRMLQILPGIVSCNNNAPTVCSIRCTVRPSFIIEWRWKMRIKVFLEQSTVGPFADVMRRNVALMEPHYAERRFSLHSEVSNLFTGVLNMPSLDLHLY